MPEQGIEIDERPVLKDPLLIAGFEGWGNALNVSHGMAAFLIRKLNAKCFARLNPDLFYRYDKSRPFVDIKDGILKEMSPPGGSFYVAGALSAGRDIIILKSDEPQLRWGRFVDNLFSLCHDLGVKTIVTLGSMYDNVLHSDRILSGIASDDELLSKLKEKQAIPINYQGPSAIHSTIHLEAKKRGFQSLSLWCHCPYYLEGAVHFGLLAHLGALLSFLGGFELDTEELETEWRKLNRQIQDLIEGNPELKTMINEIRKAKVRASWTGMKGATTKGNKIINLNDYINSR
ncbi:MAG: PAC2 family protein [Deltaproteobacteria bacterium]|jgi:proteasome assembly chaperone (PAC2) family protein|nr:PAC2 family protein [Deltaproteobacteria bacterium]